MQVPSASASTHAPKELQLCAAYALLALGIIDDNLETVLALVFEVVDDCIDNDIWSSTYISTTRLVS